MKIERVGLLAFITVVQNLLILDRRGIWTMGQRMEQFSPGYYTNNVYFTVTLPYLSVINLFYNMVRK